MRDETVATMFHVKHWREAGVIQQRQLEMFHVKHPSTHERELDLLEHLSRQEWSPLGGGSADDRSQPDADMPDRPEESAEK